MRIFAASISLLAVFIQMPIASGTPAAPLERFDAVCKRARGITYTRSIQGNKIAGDVFGEEGRITIQDAEGIFLPNEEGRWDWSWRGPKNDKEWAWLMNRHRFLLFLAESGRGGREASYGQARLMLNDWIASNPMPTRWSYSYGWRALEVARRTIGSWAPLLARDDVDSWVDDALKARWLTSLEQHATYLYKHHHFQGNHLITEMNALLVLAHLLADHPKASEWKRYALDRLVQQLDEQFFPDGMHRELSNHYHRIALDGLMIAAEIAPETITTHPKWESAWKALVDITMPNGFGPMNNDGDIENNRLFLEKYPTFVPAEDKSGALYFRSAGPSGQFIARRKSIDTNWWLMADFGPYGSDHQHQDRLHISWALGQHPILVDNGRYHYRNDAWRIYFRGEQAHNTLTLAKAKALQPEWGTENMEQASKNTLSGGNEEWAWATAPKVFKTMLGIVVVQRTVVTLADGEILVIDQRDSLSGGEATTLWNFHPDCAVTESATGDWRIQTHDTSAVLRNVFPSSGTITALKGQENPFIAGWHAPDYNVKHPSWQLRATFQAKERAHVWQLSSNPNSPAPEAITHMDGKISIHWPQPTERRSILIDGFGTAPVQYE